MYNPTYHSFCPSKLHPFFNGLSLSGLNYASMSLGKQHIIKYGQLRVFFWGPFGHYKRIRHPHKEC